jgi:hypothetical protein
MEQTAIVVVTKEWIDTGVRFLLNDGKMSGSTSNTHIVTADVENTSDQRGLWLKNVKTRAMKRDGSVVTMRLMIPWTFVLGLGLVGGERDTPGFVTEGTHVWPGPQGAA